MNPPSIDPNEIEKTNRKKTLAANIRARLVDKGWNQSELGRRAGLNRDCISVYASGKSLPGTSHLAKLAQALGCKPADLCPWLADQEGEIKAASEGTLPSLMLRDMGQGKMLVRVEQVVPATVALQIAQLLCGQENAAA